MGRNAEEYKRLLKSLLPKGKIWNREDGSTLSEFLHGEAEELARLETRSEELLVERDTRKTTELLIEHETDFSIPDDCSELAGTIEERRRLLTSKLTAIGQQDKDYFIEVALSLGYVITINEFSPFICGVGESGDPCGDLDVLFYWEVLVQGQGAGIVYFTSGESQSGDPLQFTPGADLLKCVFAKLKPAHTVIIYGWSGPGFSNGFSNGFDSIRSDELSYLEGGFSNGFSNGFDIFKGGGFDNGFSNGFRIFETP
jgi:uncharacterized protein YmfQ (DUF2313 family)